jgi:DHA1 family inner membrane transport protein
VRRPVFLVYALVFVTELLQASFIPLLPTFGRELGLSKVQAGATLSAMTLATVLVAVPAGMLADRIGARLVVVAAGSLLALGALVQALSGSFWMLLAGRAVYGIAFGTVWTAGLAVITAAAPGRSGALAGTVTAGGTAHFVGPAFSGFLADLAGVAAPLLVAGGIAVGVTVLLALSHAPAVPATERGALGAALRAARREPRVRSALALIALIGTVVGIVQLLIPLQLAANGLSAAGIGATFSVAAGVWMLSSGVAARLGERAVRARVAGVGALVIAAAVTLPVASFATAALVAFLVARALFGAPLSTIAYPLAEVGARARGVGTGTVLGLMNLVWGVAAFASPLVGGALAESAGERSTYVVLLCLALAVGATILRTSGRAVEPRSA